MDEKFYCFGGSLKYLTFNGGEGEGGFTKNQYRGGRLPKKRGARQERGGWCFEGV